LGGKNVSFFLRTRDITIRKKTQLRSGKVCGADGRGKGGKWRGISYLTTKRGRRVIGWGGKLLCHRRWTLTAYGGVILLKYGKKEEIKNRNMASSKKLTLKEETRRRIVRILNEMTKNVGSSHLTLNLGVQKGDEGALLSWHELKVKKGGCTDQ